MSDPDPDAEAEVNTDSPASEKAERKRPGRKSLSKFAPLDMTVEEAFAELSTSDGIMRRRAELYLRSRRGGTDLELEYIKQEDRLLNKMEAAVKARDQINAARELKSALESMQKMAQGTRSDAIRRSESRVPPLVPRSKGSVQ